MAVMQATNPFAFSMFGHSGNGGTRPASVLRKDWSGRRDKDPALSIPGMPPQYGDWILPHVTTFQGIISSVSRVYRPSDEAIKDSLENARFMRNDCSISECVEQRQRSVSLLDWSIEPADEADARGKWLADELTNILRETPKFHKFRENLLNALWFGKYGINMRYRWKFLKGRPYVAIEHWRPVHGDKIVYRYDDGSGDYMEDQIGIRVGAGYTSGANLANEWTADRINRVEPTDYGLAYFLEPDERDALAIHQHIIEDGEYEDPRSAAKVLGVGIRSKIYWVWMQKQECLAMLMEFLERSALGIEIWYYPWGNPEAEAKTRKAATERIGNGRNIILVPRPLGEDGMAYGVERIEPAMGGADTMRDILTSYFGHQIKRYILGQVLTTEAEATGLGSNLASVHLDTYLQIVRYDALSLEETINNEVVKHLQQYNFPKFHDVPVKFRILTEAPDIEGKLAAWQKAYDMGCKIPASEVMDLIGIKPVEPGEEVLRSPEHQNAEMQQQQMAQQAAMGRQQDPGAPQATQPQEPHQIGYEGPPNDQAAKVWSALEAQRLEDALRDSGAVSAEGAAQAETGENPEDSERRRMPLKMAAGKPRRGAWMDQVFKRAGKG
jgi:phage gp29-like protein